MIKLMQEQLCSSRSLDYNNRLRMVPENTVLMHVMVCFVAKGDHWPNID